MTLSDQTHLHPAQFKGCPRKCVGEGRASRRVIMITDVTVPALSQLAGGASCSHTIDLHLPHHHGPCGAERDIAPGYPRRRPS